MMNNCVGRKEMGATVKELKKVLETYENTWNDMKGDSGYDIEEVHKYENYVMVLRELVTEYEDMYKELMNEFVISFLNKEVEAIRTFAEEHDESLESNTLYNDLTDVTDWVCKLVRNNK